MKLLNKIFSHKIEFEEDEIILKHKIISMLYLSFLGGIGLFLFSIFRYMNGNIIVSATQMFFSLFLFFGFYSLKRNKHFYKTYSIIIFVIFFFYIHIIFFYVPENSLNILWIILAPVLIFYFLDRAIGTFFLFLLLGFIAYLIYEEYPYTIVEYITLFFVLTTAALIMYAYENLKDSENNRLKKYNEKLKKEVADRTHELAKLNENLQDRVEEELAKTTRQEQMLLRQNRMANLGQMIDAIAHQWRQPLMNINAVLMNIDSDLEFSKNPREIQKRLQELFVLTAHMSRTIEDFRNMYKTGKEQERFALSDMVHEVLSILKGSLKGVEVKSDIACSLELNVCKSELSQVFIIIISNAVDAFKLANIEHKQISIFISETKSECIIKIRDNAGGINADTVSKIFDPYFTTKSQTGGTGLGLYIAKIIITHNMKGTILAQSSDEFSEFIIKIPRSIK